MEKFSLNEISKHNHKKNCWIILYNKVYNVTSFIDKHPGQDFILQVAGTDGTAIFESIHSTSTKKMLNNKEFIDKYYIGELCEKDRSQTKYNSEFAKEIKEEKEKYFKSVENTPYARGGLYEKMTVYSKFVIITLLSLYCKYYSIIENRYLYSILYGIIITVIVMNICHGACHGELIKHYPKWFSKLSQYSGFYVYINYNDWMYWHNVLHHQYTNTHNDIDQNRDNIIRVHKYLKLQLFHKYQHYYTFIITLLGHFTFIKHNIIYFIVNIIINNIVSYKIYNKNCILNLILESCSFGYILAFLNYITHTNLKTDYKPTIKDCWYEHQMCSTSNYYMNNYFVTHLFGGINYQIEHHLFTSVHHFHYPALSKIVCKVSKKHNIPYLSFDTYFQALKSHYLLLKKLGKDE